MKKLTALLLILCMLGSAVSALAATTGYVSENRIATRSGPGTKYTEPGTFLSRGEAVQIHSRVWDARNEMYWVQVEFESRGEKYRVYTGDWRLSADLTWVPDEVIEGYSWVLSNTRGYAGPGYDYHYYGNILLYRNTACTVIEAENNFVLVDVADSSEGETRVWLPLSAIAGGSAYAGRDTFRDDSWDDGPVLLPGGSGSSSWIEPVGQYVTVWVDSGNARSGPGTSYAFLNYVHQGDVLYVLDRQMGNTGKDWYQVRINSRLCWVSSGLVELAGNREGTAYGVPIIPEDPFAEYPQASTHLIGRWFRVNPSSAHVRHEPHTDTPTVAYVTGGQCYEILDCRIGNTGKVWYKITVEGTTGWISSGMTTLLSY